MIIDNAWYYTLSTIAQTLATILGLAVVFSTIRLQSIIEKINNYKDKAYYINKRIEKHIVALLYFLFSLKKVDNDIRPKIIIFDDPMTSNDDTMRYLMISEIQKICRDIGDGNFLFLLTHNCHFYLNVRPNTAVKYKRNGQEISFYKKYGNYCLFSDGKQTRIKNIEKGKQDFKTNYELLWKEIKFLYEEDNATVDIMLNPFRKICETYMKFNCVAVDKFFENNFSVKKLYDVNQHSADDLEAEQNGKTKEDIKRMLKELFCKNNAEDHFNKHWL
jgi:hypothetical protein